MTDDRKNAELTDAPDSEPQLVARLRSGDGGAFEELVRSHTGAALAVARGILSNEADAADAVQDAFLSFVKSLDRFRGGARLSTWLHRIVVNAALMKIRTLKRRNERNIGELLPTYLEDGHRTDPKPAWEMATDEIVERREMRARVHEKLSELPEDYRNVLILRDIQQLSTAEAAEQLGETQGNVKTRLHRARQALRRLLEEELS